MSNKPESRTISLTYGPSTYIPNYDKISRIVSLKIVDDKRDHDDLIFLYDPKFAELRRLMPLPNKRIFNIPHKRMNNWNNYIVQSSYSDYLESWRKDCKIPENWMGPKRSC